MTTLEHTSQDEDLARFQAWLPDEFEMRVAVKRENDQWFALHLEFDITGAGDSIADAVEQSFELLVTYLCAYFEEGASFEEALRPIPRALRVRIGVESALASALRHTMVHLPLTDERTYSLPPGLLPRFAT
jgi:hypothetical protein